MKTNTVMEASLTTGEDQYQDAVWIWEPPSTRRMFDSYLESYGDTQRLQFDPSEPAKLAELYEGLCQDRSFSLQMRQACIDVNEPAGGDMRQAENTEQRRQKIEAITTAAQLRRTTLWKAVAVASGLTNSMHTDRLFGFVEGGEPQFQLSDERDGIGGGANIPLQLRHFSRGALPAPDADKHYNEATDLLAQLNRVFGPPERTMDEEGMDLCLEGLIGEEYDFGQAYGYLRPWWRKDKPMAGLLRLMEERKEEDRALRQSAMNGVCIVDPRIPPRRVWDLYSNRVLPYYALDLPSSQATSSTDAVLTVDSAKINGLADHRAPSASAVSGADMPLRESESNTASKSTDITLSTISSQPSRSEPDLGRARIIPINLWAVSHSWVDEDKRRPVSTPINGYEWPVPVPIGTTLDQVRIELLNMGAEYVFLDVLCMRQGGKPEKEFLRKQEWRLDVPTVGHIYQHRRSQSVIIYFNGLGMPFRVTPHMCASPTYWLNRIWTLQETVINWVPGGLTTDVFDAAGSRRSTLRNLIGDIEDVLDATSHFPPDLFTAVEAVRLRQCATPVDRITGLAYLLGCETLPLYDPDQDVEDAWDSLVQVMNTSLRTDLLLWWAGEGSGKRQWRPSWEQLLACHKLAPFPYMFYSAESLLEFSPQGRMNGGDADTHKGYVIESCFFVWSARRFPTLEVHSSSEGPPLRPFKINSCNMPSSRTKSYVIVGVAGLQYWVVGEAIRKRLVGGEIALEMKKVSVFMMNITEERQRLQEANLGKDSVRIIYC